MSEPERLAQGLAMPGGWLVVAAVALFWIAMLGLLWRRSLIGMLVGTLIGWLSVAVAALGFTGLQAIGETERAEGGVLVLCVVVVGAMQGAVGVAIVLTRIRRRGTLDADDAGLLEG